MPRRKIEPLAEYVIDQIKAGEVIERPAALVKEVVENALDAGASRIDLELKNNGLELIRIEDDGHGMAYDELPLAFQRHATSKMKKFNDIYELSSYGFRGEALASTAGIARVICTSSPPKESGERGGRFVISGGAVEEHSPYESRGHGTSLFIKDLFYNTPARLKFIKSQTAERNALTKAISSFVIANPGVAFSVKWDDGEKIFYPSVGGDREKRIGRIFYGNKSKKVYRGSAEYDNYHVEVFASGNSTKSNYNKQQFIFVGGRLIEEGRLHHLIIKNLPSLWETGTVGHYCALFTVPPGEIDVNVHPRKSTVKFIRPEVVYALAKSAISKIEGPRREAPLPTPSPPRYTPSYTPESTTNRKKETGLERKEFIALYPNKFSLLERGGLYHLVHHQKLLREIVGRFIEGKRKEEDGPIPLLICEPLSLGLDSRGKVEYLESLGFETDSLDKGRIILKSFPKALVHTPFVRLANAFLRAASSGPSATVFLESAEKVSFEGPDVYRYLEDHPGDFRSVRPMDEKTASVIFDA